MKKIYLLALVVLGFSANSFAQTTASANATAIIVTPIGITKTADMNFGNVAVSPTAGGTVVLTPGGATSPTLGVTLPLTSAITPTAASFAITGSPSYAYTVTLPTNLTLTSGANTITVNTFTSNPSGTGGVLSAGGTQTLSVGATLNVPAAKPAGTYTSITAFDVTVNYN